MTHPLISVDGRSLSVTFDRFDLEAYNLFLRCKALPEMRIEFDPNKAIYRVNAPARYASLLDGNLTVAASPIHHTPAAHLWDYQAHHALQAFEARRFAYFWDCGLGKTPTFLDWCRMVVAETNGRVVILTLPELVEQTLEMARQFGMGGTIEPIATRAELRKWCTGAGPGMAIATYHKLLPPPGERAPNAGVIPEFRHLAGIVCDESSILRSGGGVIKWNLIHSAKGVPFKLSCTATPAPNDRMEYASQASFLEKLRSENEVLWTFFNRDKEGNWQVKSHAKEAFYRFLAGWSSYLRDPKKFGWADNLKDIPAAIFRSHSVDATPAQLSEALALFAKGGEFMVTNRMGIVERGKAMQLAKGFLYEGDAERLARPIASNKPTVAAELIQDHVTAGRQVLIWTQFNEEGRILSEILGTSVDFEVLDGKTPPKKRAPMLEAFRRGETQALIGKAGMIGYGLNFQHCGAQVWSGFSDSYEDFYQGVRRSLRYGLTEPLYVDTVHVPELEGMVIENLARKRLQFEEDADEQERYYLAAMLALRPSP